VGASVSDGTAVAANNWGYIDVRGTSSVMIDNAIIRYASYGLYQVNDNPTALTLLNTDFKNIYYYGIQIQGNTGDVALLNLDTVSFTDVGVNTNSHGIYLDINNDATFTGVWNSVTMNNMGGDGILVDDDSTGAVDITISGLTIGDTGTVGQYGIDLQGDATANITFNNSVGVNAISGGSYNLLLRGVVGSYSSLTLGDGTGGNPLYFSLSANPTSWDDSTIIINGNTPL